ncbi:MAG: DUF6776 family protein [Nevskiales bacterium]
MPAPQHNTGVRHVIRVHRPWLRWAVVGACSVAILIGSFALYALGRSQSGNDWTHTLRLEAEQRRLVAEIRRLRAENGRLSERVVLLERAGEIDKRAATVINQSLRDEQAALAALKEQVAFYRGIVSPEESSAGVRVYELQLRPGSEPELYQYDLVLIQVMRHDNAVAGSADLAFIGLQDGQPRNYRLAELEVERGKTLLFSFRYFQQLSGSIRLPRGFTPTRVQIDVIRNGNPPIRFQQMYDWNKVQYSAGA